MLERLVKQIGEHPKLDQWQPPLCGDIDINIDGDGRWYCQGAPMQRQRLAQLFASVLRCEADGQYYLVTPQEKWRVQVADLPFVLTDYQCVGGTVRFTGTMGVVVELSAAHRWQLRDGLPAVELWHGNWARLSRPLYYQFAEQAELRDGCYGVDLNGHWCVLGLD
ncbi:DUF1285 domain-containing protein [Ferrimonas senticii]|uniref:DUF1285 domain-containing protein n=1 Tax=Ferrimonas senticii TaxID=394566 RepID=UPI0003F9303B|nr:DUF1285 domain-containing protein [Ferrimonas senticii]